MYTPPKDRLHKFWAVVYTQYKSHTIINDMLQLSERTLGDWLEHWAEVTPDKEYIVYSDRNLRFTWEAV